MKDQVFTGRTVSEAVEIAGRTLGLAPDALRYVVLERETPAKDEDPLVTIPFTTLAEARLILTDDLIRDALKADKAARQAANENFESEDDA